MFDLWHLSLLVAGALSVLSAFFFWRQSWWVKLPLLVLVLYAVVVALFQPIGYMTIMAFASQAQAGKFLIYLAVIMTLFCLPFRFLDLVAVLTMGVLLADQIWVLFGAQGIYIGNTHSTLIGAIFAPIIWKRLRWAVLLLAPTFLAVRGEGALVVYGIHLLILVRQAWPKYLLLASIIPLAVYAPTGFYPTSRVNQIWGPAFLWWTTKVNPWIGTGPLSYEVLSPTFAKPRMWMHSAPLQILFEMGIIGLTAYATLLTHAAYIVRKNRVALSVVLAYAVGSIVYSPEQFPVVWVLMAYTIRGAYGSGE